MDWFYTTVASVMKEFNALLLICIHRDIFLILVCIHRDMFDQVTFACKEFNNFQNSKSIFMISDLKIFPIMLLSMEIYRHVLRMLNFGVLSV